VNPHISDDLPRLLTGEATRQETLAAAEHLRSCPDCQQELVSAVVAHASLTSAQRFAPEIVAPNPNDQRDPPTRLPDRPPAALPDLSAMFAKVRAEATVSPPRSAPASRGRWLAAGAAAAVVLAGGAVAAAELLGGGSSTVAQTVTLRPVGDVSASATASISDGTMRIDASALPKLGTGRQYEVWLVAAGGKRLRPVGYVGENRTATLPVAPQVMSRYDGIAISVQKTDQVQFSGHIAVSGQYA
jgi:hypothetical protein